MIDWDYPQPCELLGDFMVVKVAGEALCNLLQSFFLHRGNFIPHIFLSHAVCCKTKNIIAAQRHFFLFDFYCFISQVS